MPAGPIYKMNEVFADPQVQHLGMAATVHHPKLGDITIVNQPIKLSRTPAAIVKATPELGEDTDAVLTELGHDAATIAAWREKGVIA